MDRLRSHTTKYVFSAYTHTCAQVQTQPNTHSHQTPNTHTTQPVVVTDVVTKWPAFEKWSMEHLLENYGDVLFRAGPIDITLADYWRYAVGVKEEAPIYLFDKK